MYEPGAEQSSESVKWDSILPKQYHSKLLKDSIEKNIIISTNHSKDKSFITLKFIQEFAHKVQTEQNIIVLIEESNEQIDLLTSWLENLTDLKIQPLHSLDKSRHPSILLRQVDVLITNSQLASFFITNKYLIVDYICAVIIYECHLVLTNKPLARALTELQNNQSLHLIGFTHPLFDKGYSNPAKVVTCVRKLQTFFNASIYADRDTLVNLKYASNATELIVEYDSTPPSNLYQALASSATTLINFYNDLNSHFPALNNSHEEGHELPDSSGRPLELLHEFISVLNTLGVWCANKAAYYILCILSTTSSCCNTHGLLLSLLQTEMIKARKMCASAMDHLEERQALCKYSSHKVMRLLEILNKYKPSVIPDGELRELFTKNKIMLGSEDFVQLQVRSGVISKLPDDQDDNLCDVYTFKGHNRAVVTSKQRVAPHLKQSTSSSRFKPVMSFVKFVRSSCYAFDGYEPLCSILLVESEVSARVILNLLCYVRRLDPTYWWIAPQCVQIKRGEKSNSRQVEEKLEKFRTKECNILIGTNLIEQDYKLPKCNLVMSFEPSFSYSSYVLTKCAGYKGTNKLSDSNFVLFSDGRKVNRWVKSIARYKLMSEILLTVYSNSGVEEEEDDEEEVGACEECSLGSEEEIEQKELSENARDVNAHLSSKPNYLRMEGEMSIPLEISEQDCFAQQSETYFKRTASCFQNCRPSLNGQSLLYQIRMKLVKPLSLIQNRKGKKVYRHENYSQGFSLLVAKKIPNIRPFHIFDQSGEIEVTLELADENIVLGEEQLVVISNFHDFTFMDVLKFNKDTMSYDPLQCENSFFVVPTVCTGETIQIDWTLLQKIAYYQDGPLQTISEEKRKLFQFDVNDFENAVVMPWYRNQHDPLCYCVVEIMYGMSPNSMFARTTKYSTFREYYLLKHGLNIQNSTQPLLAVEKTPSCQNFLSNRHISDNAQSISCFQSSINFREKEQLVPELCEIHPFPAPLWCKAASLPSILYRMNNYLLASDLRSRVAGELGLENMDLKVDILTPAFGTEGKPDGLHCKLTEGGRRDDEDITKKSKESGSYSGNFAYNIVDTEAEEPFVLSDATPSSFSWEDIDVAVFDGEEDFEKDLREKQTLCDDLIKIHEDDLVTHNLFRSHKSVAISREKLNKPETNVGISRCTKHLASSATRAQCSSKPAFKLCPSNVSDPNPGIIRDIHHTFNFSYDHQDGMEHLTRPSLNIMLQALTLSHANDTVNLERLETIGDSFMKYATSVYLYLTYPDVNEGQLTRFRTREVSNANLCKLGKKKSLGEHIVATRFEPKINWLPPCYVVSEELERALNDEDMAKLMNLWKSPCLKDLTFEEFVNIVYETKLEQGGNFSFEPHSSPSVPYNLLTQHSISDKSIADCAEALIGAYLIECGPRGALLFMSWLGLTVLPKEESNVMTFGYLQCPPPPMSDKVGENSFGALFYGIDSFEDRINYKFRNRSYLVQAMTHASYSPNKVSDNYQRLEFLGDAILDYIITRHLYHDDRAHSPGALTDLRSALVNNKIFAALSVKFGFHKLFKHLIPSLHDVIQKFVLAQSENNFTLNLEDCLLEEEERGEVIEARECHVPKSLADIFESVAGAIFLDSGMSLDTVWKVYYGMMKPAIDSLSTNVPISPVRELYELQPCKVIFSKAEKLADGRRFRVIVEVIGKGKFSGIGWNCSSAKSTAARCALEHLKKKSKNVCRV